MKNNRFLVLEFCCFRKRHIASDLESSTWTYLNISLKKRHGTYIYIIYYVIYVHNRWDYIVIFYIRVQFWNACTLYTLHVATRLPRNFFHFVFGPLRGDFAFGLIKIGVDLVPFNEKNRVIFFSVCFGVWLPYIYR